MILESLLGAIQQATGIAPQAYMTDKAGKPAITYSFYRATDNGAVATYRLQTRVFGKTQEQAIEVEQKITDSLVTLGDSTKFGCSISSNGGGALLDAETNTPQVLTYFDVVAKH